MSDFLANSGGYTPVPDELVRRYDFSTAYVWGVVWRYAQQEKGICNASHEAMAERAGISRRALMEKLNTLIEDGFIEDMTPNIRNRPHSLSTKKGEELILEGRQNLPTSVEKQPDGYAEFAHQDELGRQILPTSVQNLPSETPDFTPQNGVGRQILPMKKEESLNNIISNRESRETHTRDFDEAELLGKALNDICGYDLDAITNGTKKRLADALSFLIRKKATPQMVKRFRDEYWWGTSPPKPDQITEEWNRFLASVGKSSGKSKGKIEIGPI